jgi:hypothetical protein
MMGTYMVPKTSARFSSLTWLVARENFINEQIILHGKMRTWLNYFFLNLNIADHVDLGLDGRKHLKWLLINFKRKLTTISKHRYSYEITGDRCYESWCLKYRVCSLQGPTATCSDVTIIGPAISKEKFYIERSEPVTKARGERGGRFNVVWLLSS